MKLWLSRMRTAWRVLPKPEGGITGVSAAPRGRICPERRLWDCWSCACAQEDAKSSLSPQGSH